MKVLIIGCGVIGTIYGWALSQANQEVIHLVRKEKFVSLQTGIELDIYDLRQTNALSVSDQLEMSLLNAAGRGHTDSNLESAIIPTDLTQNHPREQFTTYYPKLIDELSADNDFDLVIVPTKHYQLIETLREVYPYLSKTEFLIFCAHWQDLKPIDAIIPRSQYILGYPASSGGYDDNHKMVINIRSDYRIGDYDGTHAELLKKIIDLFASAGFTPDIKANMLEWLWVHHAINGGTIGSLLYAGGFDALHDPAFAKQFHAATLEAIDVLRKRGVNVNSYPDVETFLKQSPEQLLECYRKLFIETPIGQRTMRAGHHKHSMEEMRQYYLDVVNTGKMLGVAMPTLNSYYQQINTFF